MLIKVKEKRNINRYDTLWRLFNETVDLYLGQVVRIFFQNYLYVVTRHFRTRSTGGKFTIARRVG